MLPAISWRRVSPTSDESIWKGALTIPNGVSSLRLLAIPYFWWVLLAQRRVGLAALLIFVIGSTDWIDGYLARRLDQVSEIGKFLDPLADRLMIASAVVGGMIAGVLPTIIGVPLIVRETLVGLGALLVTVRGDGKVAVRPLGKAATFLLYGAIPAFYLVSAGIAASFFAPPAWIAGVTGLTLYYWVAVEYAIDVWGADSR